MQRCGNSEGEGVLKNIEDCMGSGSRGLTSCRLINVGFVLGVFEMYWRF